MSNASKPSGFEIDLWDDNPAEVDYLGFDAVVGPTVAALATRSLDPVTIGIHGPWGSGKSTILKLLAAELKNNNRYIVVETDPWEYDEHDDVKGTLIAAVLEKLRERAAGDEGITDKVRKLLRRISWSRVGLALAKGAITMQWDPEKIIDAFQPKAEDGPTSMAGFRQEFAALVEELPDVDRVVVLVDDLDRCLPSAVMATLEAIKLFLAVPRMVFVIAADTEMVRDSIAASLEASGRSDVFAARYLDKIVQIPVSLPQLSPEEAEAYIALLLVHRSVGPGEGFTRLLDHCFQRRKANAFPLLADFKDDEVQLPEDALRLAAQISQGLGADRVRNPREIKRFLNAYGIRRSISELRGAEVSPAALVKLLLLEDRFRKEFDVLTALPSQEQKAILGKWEAWGRGEEKDPPPEIRPQTKAWAATEPFLANLELGPYISLAASLVSAPRPIGVSDELAVLLSRMTHESLAVRGKAIKEAADLDRNDRDVVVAALISRLRRASDPSLEIEVLIELGTLNEDAAFPIARAVEESAYSKLGPNHALLLATAKRDPLTQLARKISRDENLDPMVRQAAIDALKES